MTSLISPPATAMPSPHTPRELGIFSQGLHAHVYRWLGSRAWRGEDAVGVAFTHWAPGARSVAVEAIDAPGVVHELRQIDSTGVWHGFLPDVGEGFAYRYRVVEANGALCRYADPFAWQQAGEAGPASLVAAEAGAHAWSDRSWLLARGERSVLDSPLSIYQLDPGSWRRVPEQANRKLSYRELAPLLVQHMFECGFSHVLLTPLPLGGRGGGTGRIPATLFGGADEHGLPTDLMHFVDELHRHEIGVLLEWPAGELMWALARGNPFGRDGARGACGLEGLELTQPEARSFLLSSACLWVDRYHFDGLYMTGLDGLLDPPAELEPAEGVAACQAAREILSRANDVLHHAAPGVLAIADAEADRPELTRPTWLGGLGFDLRADRPAMRDALRFLGYEAGYRGYHQHEVTRRMFVGFTDRFLHGLPASEFRDRQPSLLARMPGDTWRKFANLRLLYALRVVQPGAKLMFMGQEFGQWGPWQPERSLDWHLLSAPPHAQVQRWVHDLNLLYRGEPALYQLDLAQEGFEWIAPEDPAVSALQFLRVARTHPRHPLLVVLNFMPEPLYGWPLSVPVDGYWRELLNSDAREYGGSGVGNLGGVWVDPVRGGNPNLQLRLTLPPLGALFLRAESA